MFRRDFMRQRDIEEYYEIYARFLEGIPAKNIAKSLINSDHRDISRCGEY